MVLRRPYNHHLAVVAATFLLLALSVPVRSEPPAAKSFVAHLDGGQEVPANNSAATGQAIFQLNEDRTQLTYGLIVANIENVVASHIHLGAAGT